MRNIILSKAMLIYSIISIIYLILVFFIGKLYLYITLEKRLESNIIKTTEEDSLSIIDNILIYLKKIIKRISRLLEKSQIAHKYGNRLQKYLIYFDKSKQNNTDIISIKVLSTIIMQILYLVTNFITGIKISFIGFLLTSVASFFAYDFLLMYLHNNKKNLIEEQLLQAVVIMNSAFKSGKNIYEAIDIVKRELPNPIKKEFETIALDINYGLDLETVFNRFYNRIKLEEAKYITSSLSLLNKTGGNIVTVFNMIEKNFYDRIKIKNELSALTSTSKLLYKSLLAMPIIFVLTIILLNPGYFAPLITTKIGTFIDIVIIGLYIIYIALIKQITKVKKV